MIDKRIEPYVVTRREVYFIETPFKDDDRTLVVTVEDNSKVSCTGTTKAKEWLNRILSGDKEDEN